MSHYPQRLRFVESGAEYSTYNDLGGNAVYVQNGTGKLLVEFRYLDIDAEWRLWNGSVQSFFEHLRESVIDPDEVERLTVCDDCDRPVDEDYTTHVIDRRGVIFDRPVDENYTTHVTDRRVCDDSCLDDYHFCEGCDEYSHGDDIESTLYDEYRCHSCIESGYRYCEDCGGYVIDDDYDHDHDEEDSCDCESPVQRFAVRNDGNEPLANDVRTTVSLPSGEISDEGIGAIARLLRTQPLPATDAGSTPTYLNPWYNLASRLDEIGRSWQAKNGNFPKRLSRFAYKEFGLKISPDVLSEVGNIGNAHSRGVSFGVEVTRDLNLSAYEFGHEDSCFWQSYYESRCTLKSNGGFGLRSFDESGNVTGRAWVFPLRNTANGLTATFDTEAPDGFAVFNGYGDLSGYTAARIVSHMAGLTYRKVGFGAGVVYVNGNSGYLVASEEIVSRYADNSLTLYVDSHSNLHSQEVAARDAALAA